MKLAFTIIPLLTEILCSLFHKIQRVLLNVKEKPASVLVAVLLLATDELTKEVSTR